MGALAEMAGVVLVLPATSGCSLEQWFVLPQALYRLTEESRMLVRGCSDEMCCLVSHRNTKFGQIELECSL